MTSISFGDLAQPFVLGRQSAALKVDLQRLSKETTTGLAADTSAHLGGYLSPLLAIDGSLARAEGFRIANLESAQMFEAMQTSLSVIDKTLSDASGALLSAVGTHSPTRLSAVVLESRQKLNTAISALNTRFADRSIFAGAANSQAPVVSADTLMAQLQPVVAGLTTAVDIKAAVVAWFDSPTGFAAQAYQGGGPIGTLPIAPGETIQHDVTAQDPALRDSLRGLAMAALIGSGAVSLSVEEQGQLAKTAALDMLETQTGRALYAAHIGIMQNQVDGASTRNSSEKTAMQLARNEMTHLDDFETATKLKEAEAQLEKIYAITARMSRLSILDFLR